MSRELDEMRREMAPLQLQAKDLKRDRDTKKRNLVQTRGLLDEVKGDIESKRIEIKALDRRLADLASGVDQTNPREQDLRENIKRVQQYRAKMVRDAPGLKNAIPEADGKVDQAKIALHEVRARCEEVNNKLGMARDQRDNLGQQTSDPLAAFGSQMHRVLAAIDRGRWRAGPPIGPLGRYVKLKDERYRDIVQAVLGNLLCSFIVRCHEDKDELVRILKHCAQQGYVPGNRRRGLPSITIHKGDNFDFSSGDLSRLGTTILSVLEVGS
jgi:chromosome segregation ATPase